jgi:RNA polymerase sigma-54 factor
MSVKLTHSLQQRLVLTPQLRQRIEMLQMTSIELSDLIQQQMLENPVLEEVQQNEEKLEIESGILDHHTSGVNDFDLAASPAAGADLNGANGAGDAAALEALAGGEATGEAASADAAGGEETEAGDRDHDAFEEIDFGREFQDYLDPGYKTQEYEYREDGPTFEQFLTRPESLSEHLNWQLRMSHVDGALLPAAEAVVGNLDPNGRINTTNEEIAESEGCAEEQVECARQIVMRLDPVGCGARDVRECLLVQLEARGDSDTLAAALIREHPLSDLQQHTLQNLSKQRGDSVESLIAELERIRTLDTYPGRRYSS